MRLIFQAMQQSPSASHPTRIALDVRYAPGNPTDVIIGDVKCAVRSSIHLSRALTVRNAPIRGGKPYAYVAIKCLHTTNGMWMYDVAFDTRS